jgi:hypothetical protein
MKKFPPALDPLIHLSFLRPLAWALGCSVGAVHPPLLSRGVFIDELSRKPAQKAPEGFRQSITHHFQSASFLSNTVLAHQRNCGGEDRALEKRTAISSTSKSSRKLSETGTWAKNPSK